MEIITEEVSQFYTRRSHVGRLCNEAANFSKTVYKRLKVKQVQKFLEPAFFLMASMRPELVNEKTASGLSVYEL